VDDTRISHRLLAAASAAIILLAISTIARAAGPSPMHEPQSNRAAAARMLAEAEQLIQQAGRSDPLDSAKVRAAIRKLNAAAHLDPRNDAALVDLGFCYGLLKEPDLAVDAYRSATRVNPSAANFKELADIYLRTGAPEDALMAANAGLFKDPRSASLYNARGMANFNLQRFDAARKDFEKALKIDPSLQAARVNLDAIGRQTAGPSTLRKPDLAR
jgi:tetratricopeptide (TPR) repeat protein